MANIKIKWAYHIWKTARGPTPTMRLACVLAKSTVLVRSQRFADGSMVNGMPFGGRRLWAWVTSFVRNNESPHPPRNPPFQTVACGRTTHGAQRLSPSQSGSTASTVSANMRAHNMCSDLGGSFGIETQNLARTLPWSDQATLDANDPAIACKQAGGSVYQEVFLLHFGFLSRIIR